MYRIVYAIKDWAERRKWGWLARLTYRWLDRK
jgi:hypothetical protein